MLESSPNNASQDSIVHKRAADIITRSSQHGFSLRLILDGIEEGVISEDTANQYLDEIDPLVTN